MKELQLGPHRVQVSDDDLERCLKLLWYPQITNGQRVFVANSGNRRITLHRFIVSAQSKQLVKFRDGNSLNCQRENLEVRSRSAVAFDACGKRDATTGYYGVTFRRGAYNATIAGRYLGSFETGEQAARAFDDEAFKLYSRRPNSTKHIEGSTTT